MPEYLKAVVPFIGGVVLLVVGALLDENTLLYVGGTLVGVSPVVAVVPNKPKPKPRKRHVRREAGYAGVHPIVVVLLAIIVFLVLWSATGSLLIALLALLLLLLLL